MDTVYARLYDVKNNKSIKVDDCVNFSFEKERYTPYTTVSGVFVCASGISSISKVRLYINDKAVHYGPVDKYEYFTEGGVSYIKFSSRGFSMGLSQNQPMPGVNLNVNLQSFIDNNITIPHVTYEQDTTVSNYIFVKETSSLWDSIVALGQKTYGEYPYICGENQVRLTKKSKASEYTILSNAPLIKRGSGVNLLNVVSNYHMKDTNDEYSYNYESENATSYEIVRHKYISLDKQWLYSPNDGLMHKSRFSQKGISYDYIKLSGVYLTDIRENVVFQDLSIKEVSKIRIAGSRGGFTTQLWFYSDEYCN